jgi:hypothetical protein
MIWLVMNEPVWLTMSELAVIWPSSLVQPTSWLAALLASLGDEPVELASNCFVCLTAHLSLCGEETELSNQARLPRKVIWLVSVIQRVTSELAVIWCSSLEQPTSWLAALLAA